MTERRTIFSLILGYQHILVCQLVCFQCSGLIYVENEQVGGMMVVGESPVLGLLVTLSGNYV